MASLAALGDSITLGIESRAGWPDLLKQTMHERMLEFSDARVAELPPPPIPRGIPVLNRSKPGMTAPEMTAEASVAIQHRHRGRLIIATMIGFCDHVIPVGEREPVVPLPDFRRNMEDLTRITENAAGAVIRLIVEPTPVDDTRPHPQNPGDISNDRLEAYREFLRLHARDTGAHFVSTYKHLRGMSGDRDPLSFDGIHLNDTGSSVIHDLVLQEVDTILTGENAESDGAVLPVFDSIQAMSQMSGDIPPGEANLRLAKVLVNIYRLTQIPYDIPGILHRLEKLHPDARSVFQDAVRAICIANATRMERVTISRTPDPLPPHADSFPSLAQLGDVSEAARMTYALLGAERPSMNGVTALEIETPTPSGLSIIEGRSFHDLAADSRPVGWHQADRVEVRYLDFVHRRVAANWSPTQTR